LAYAELRRRRRYGGGAACFSERGVFQRAIVSGGLLVGEKRTRQYLKGTSRELRFRVDALSRCTMTKGHGSTSGVRPEVGYGWVVRGLKGASEGLAGQGFQGKAYAEAVGCWYGSMSVKRLTFLEYTSTGRYA